MLTVEEVNARFANTELRFHSYYKFSFTFAGVADDGSSIEATFGGIAEDIYRYGLKAADSVAFKACDEWKFVRVIEGTKVVFEWSDDQ